MLTNGVCRPSKSPWSSRVILVSKRDGTTRFVVDYRDLNSVTTKDAYPMPNPKDILDKMQGKQFFSFLDAASAYWCVELEEEDKHKTAFATPRGHYEMNRMAFGLCNSQSTYQRLMDDTLRGVNNTDSYVDDICVYSSSFEEHLKDLRSAFTALQKANIQLRQDKCSFAVRSGHFVGHIISGEGRRPAPRNVEKIVNAPRPSNRQELQRFLGLINFYREYIEGMAHVAEPLYRLTRKEVKWEWNSSSEDAFQDLKDKLVKYPVLLAFPDWQREFYLQTDASSIAVGAILSQKDRLGKLRPLGYSSSGLTKAQRNYSAGELECWALIAASRKWRDYLHAASKVVFVSDHNPLCWLRRQKDPRGKFSRWVQELEAVEYEIRYTSGKDNAAADYLSRLPSEVDHSVNDDVEHFERHLFPISERDLIMARVRESSRGDKATSLAMDQIEHGGRVNFGRFKRLRGMHVSDGLLYKGHQLVIPHELKNEILSLVHNDAHPGTKKTIARVSSQFYWRGIPRDVQRYCKRCLVCQRNKPKNQIKEPLEPIEIAEGPRHAIAFDVATLPWSSDSHRYFLLMTDLFAKYVEIYPMADQTAESICKGLLHGWIHRHGPPAIMLSDQGANVDGKTVRGMLDKFGIEKRRSSPYHPEGDGQAERGIQTVKQVMRCTLEDRCIEKDDWPSILQEVSYNLNCLPNSSTGYSPFTIMYGIEPTPLSTASFRYPGSENERLTAAEWVDEAVKARDELNADVNSNLGKSRSRMKNNYKSSYTASSIQVGDEVLLKNEPRVDGLEPHFHGPYRVIARRSVNVKLRINDRKEKVVHLNKCKFYPHTPEFSLSAPTTTQGSQPLIDYGDSHMDQTDTGSVAESNRAVALEQESTLTPSLRRSQRSRRPPLRYREEDI